MSSDNHNLPIHVDSDREIGTITYANEVIAIIAGMATQEVEGVVENPIAPGGIADLFARSKPATRGVKVEVGTEETSVDLTVNVEYGKPIQKVCTEVQENVRKAIETMTGLHVIKVDVHVAGISFEKETQQMEESYVKATTLPEDENNDQPTADIDSPPEGVNPEDLPVRNIHLGDAHTSDEAEEASAQFSEQPDTESEEE